MSSIYHIFVLLYMIDLHLYINLYSKHFQWLVKRSMENRQEISSFVRSYAINQFKKQFEPEPKYPQYRRNILNNLNKVEEIYGPRRYFKRKTAPPPNIDSRVQITLLEYGLKSDTRGAQTEVIDDKDQETEQIEEVRNTDFWCFLMRLLYKWTKYTSHFQ